MRTARAKESDTGCFSVLALHYEFALFLASMRKDHGRAIMITVPLKAVDGMRPELLGRFGLSNWVAYLGGCEVRPKEA